MTTYDFVHLVIHAAGGKVEGRTKLQKLVYFVGVLAGRPPVALGYRPHYYGPFSPPVAGAVQELRGLKFLEQHTATAGATDEHGFEVARYDYVLTDAGREVADLKALAHPTEWVRIRTAVERLNKAPVHDYVRLAIAAKTHLMTQQVGRVLGADALREKTAEHGWAAFTPQQYDEALRFLGTVGIDITGAR